MTSRRDILRLALFVGGAFAIAYSTSTLLHELGHASAAWATGGEVGEIVIHPFSWSWVVLEVAPEKQAYVTWAGAGLSAVAGLGILFTAWIIRSTWIGVALMIPPTTFTIDGLYLPVDALLRAGGDGTSLVALGTPLWLVIALGAGLIAAGAVAACMVMPRFGLTTDATLPHRLDVLFAGIGPYLVAMLAYHVLFNRDELLLWTVWVGCAALLIAALAAGSRVWARRWPRWQMAPATIGWPHALVASGAGVALVTWLLL